MLLDREEEAKQLMMPQEYDDYYRGGPGGYNMDDMR